MHAFNNALFIGKVLHELDHVESTNSYALQLLSKSRPIEGTAIIAYNQYKGRGHFGNEWQSQSGKNLTLSIILYPDFIHPADQFILNQAVSLGVRDFAERVLQKELKIKWPNDIYYLDRKLGGILIENSIQGNRLTYSVVGIGININQTQFEHSLPNPTSFKLIQQMEFDIPDLLSSLFPCIESRYMQLKNKLWDPLRASYLEVLYKLNEPSYFADNTKQLFKGKITGVRKTGQLLLEIDGKEQSFDFKEIIYV